MTNNLIIATRESQLALWQAYHIRDRLQELHPGLTVELLGMTTVGDQRLDTPLSRIGGKGLFIKELEQAMLEDRAHLAVHSLKDVPMDMPEGFDLVAITGREDPCDAFVSNNYKALSELPAGGRVGSSSLRRQAQIRARFPHLTVDTLRGNVNTRLRKLDEDQYDAIILASAGLKRLGFTDRIAAIMTPEESLPAIGQGALGIEIRSGRPELAELLAPLNDPISAACAHAERTVGRRLQGGCQAPIGGYCVERDGRLHLRAFVADTEGKRLYRAEAEGPLAEPEALGDKVAQDLINQGADRLLAELLQQQE